MRQYELTYLISDSVSESDLNKVTGKVGGYIADLSGKMIKEEIWGRRKLAYPIKKQEFATYVTIYFELNPEKANELEREIRLTNEVIRHLMIVKEYEHETLTLTKEEVAETKEIENVIGGEKSFEAVEGETEESKNLMAVREAEEEAKEEEESEAPVEEKKEETKEEAIEAPKEEKTEEPVKEKKVTKKAPTIKSKTDVGVPTENVGKKKAPKKADEADRLSKLNEELDDILKDDL